MTIREKQARADRKDVAFRWVIVGMSVLGAVIVMFPVIANWMSTLGFSYDHTNYAAEVADMPDEERERLLDSAEKYNERLPDGPLRDPYLLNEAGEAVDLRDDLPLYNAQLNTGKDQPMGWVHVPEQGINLPIFHGTTNDVLDRGAGHLHGTALPVGGDSTHSVITAHSGRANASLFSGLTTVKEGDVFFVEVLGRKTYYQVFQTITVLPNEGEYLRQVAGEDQVTLVTCTPIGVNTHRLLVQGKRIPAPIEGANEFSISDFSPDFPWWVLAVIGLPVSVWGFMRHADKKAGRRPQPLVGYGPKHVSASSSGRQRR